jgi:hypothetical protein
VGRIIYVECRDGRPALNEDGFGYCVETLTVVDNDADEWKAYMPAADHDARVAELEAENARLKNATEKLFLMGVRTVSERDQAIKQRDELQAQLAHADAEADTQRTDTDKFYGPGEKLDEWRRRR